MVLFVHVHFVSEVPLFLLYILFVFGSAVFFLLSFAADTAAADGSGGGDGGGSVVDGGDGTPQSHTTNNITNTFLSINIISIDAKPLFKHFH